MPSSHFSSRLRSSLPRLLVPRSKFTPEEVRLRLAPGQDHHPRTAAVHAVAASTAIWSALLPEAVAHDLGRAATRLPSIVYWYAQGVPPAEIGRRLSPFSSAWDAERAFGVAAGLIAQVLNRDHATAALAA